ncbi:MAG: BspA family leucine-rich repeat surface protein [Methanobrevibacter sp.]|nr:BspA family leucine-rich repeat surface protein [Methanobrevibacter sp.]
MDLFSYLLGKKSSSSGGGGGGGLNWSQIGYNDAPQSIINGYNYAKNIYDNWDATQTNLSSKYYQDYLIEYFPLVDTSKVTNVTSMFSGCSKLSYVPALTLSVSSFQELFYNCYALDYVDTSNWNTSNTTNFYRLFANCRGLTEIDMSNINAPNLTDIRQMFDGCTNLKKLDIRKFEFSNSITMTMNVFRNIPTDCLILVKDQTAKDWILAIRSDLTNIQIASEY